MRLVEIHFPDEECDFVRETVSEKEPEFWRLDAVDEEGQRVLVAFFRDGGAQPLIDAVQDRFEDRDDWRIFVLPVEATAPKPEETEDDDEKDRRETLAIREEIYEDVSRGAALNWDFIVLTAASTVIAALGMNGDNAAVVIGAMMIAPLLGPILAFSFGVALGDLALLLRAARSSLAGVAFGLALSLALGALMSVNTDSHELALRAVVRLDAVALGLAAGGAAALSVATGTSSVLVGVMVAVALLPPAAAAGLFFGSGFVDYGLRAALNLALNVVCVLLAAQAVYIWKGVRPRTWLEERSARAAGRINVAALVLLLAALVAAVVFLPHNDFGG